MFFVIIYIDFLILFIHIHNVNMCVKSTYIDRKEREWDLWVVMWPYADIRKFNSYLLWFSFLHSEDCSLFLPLHQDFQWFLTEFDTSLLGKKSDIVFLNFFHFISDVVSFKKSKLRLVLLSNSSKIPERNRSIQPVDWKGGSKHEKNPCNCQYFFVTICHFHLVP